MRRLLLLLALLVIAVPAQAQYDSVFVRGLHDYGDEIRIGSAVALQGLWSCPLGSTACSADSPPSNALSVISGGDAIIMASGGIEYSYTVDQVIDDNNFTRVEFLGTIQDPLRAVVASQVKLINTGISGTGPFHLFTGKGVGLPLWIGSSEVWNVGDVHIGNEPGSGPGSVCLSYSNPVTPRLHIFADNCVDDTVSMYVNSITATDLVRVVGGGSFQLGVISFQASADNPNGVRLGGVGDLHFEDDVGDLWIKKPPVGTNTNWQRFLTASEALNYLRIQNPLNPSYQYVRDPGNTNSSLRLSDNGVMVESKLLLHDPIALNETCLAYSHVSSRLSIGPLCGAAPSTEVFASSFRAFDDQFTADGSGAFLLFGTVNPEGSVVGITGSLFTDSVGGEAYVKNSGSGTSSGWARLLRSSEYTAPPTYGLYVTNPLDATPQTVIADSDFSSLSLADDHTLMGGWAAVRGYLLLDDDLAGVRLDTNGSGQLDILAENGLSYTTARMSQGTADQGFISPKFGNSLTLGYMEWTGDTDLSIYTGTGGGNAKGMSLKYDGVNLRTEVFIADGTSFFLDETNQDTELYRSGASRFCMDDGDRSGCDASLFVTAISASAEVYGEQFRDYTTDNFLDWNNGSPEGVVDGNPGDIVGDYTNGELYTKNTGTGNTGWERLARLNEVTSITEGLERVTSYFIPVEGVTDTFIAPVGDLVQIGASYTLGAPVPAFSAGGGHAYFFVASLAGSGTITIMGDSVSDVGVVTVGDTEVFTVDTSGVSYQTIKRFYRVASFTFGAGITAISYSAGYVDHEALDIDNDWILKGYHLEAFAQGNNPSFGFRIIKIEDLGNNKMQAPNLERIAFDGDTAVTYQVNDIIRSGERSYDSSGAPFWPDNTKIQFTSRDFETFHSGTGRHIIESATKNEGIVLRIEGEPVVATGAWNVDWVLVDLYWTLAP